jgi:hypothetical protein
MHAWRSMHACSTPLGCAPSPFYTKRKKPSPSAGRSMLLDQPREVAQQRSTQ